MWKIKKCSIKVFTCVKLLDKYESRQKLRYHKVVTEETQCQLGKKRKKWDSRSIDHPNTVINEAKD